MKIFFFIALLLSASPSYSKMIKKIIVKGATKTKTSSVKRWLALEEGQDISEDTYRIAIEKLRRAYQFNLKKVSYINEELIIEIEDKWSLFPVPIFTQSGGYYSRGLLLYENNFLGRLGTFAPGVFWTNSGLNAILYYQEDNLLAQSLGLKVIALHKNDLTQFERKGTITDTFESRFNTLIVTPNFQHGRHDHKFGPIYIKKKILNSYEQEIFHSERFGLYYRHHYNHYKKLPAMFDGYVTTYDLFVLPGTSGHVTTLQNGDIQYSKPIGDHFLKTQAHFSYTNDNGYLSPKVLGGNPGYRGYKRESLPVQRNFGAMVEPSINLGGQFYSSTFLEYNSSKLIQPVLDGKVLNEATVGINVSYYFKRLSIPAAIIEVARNIDNQNTVIHFNVGLSL